MSELTEELTKNAWNGWFYKPKENSLVYKPVDYWVDIELNSCAEVLDWVFQIHGKSWATPDVTKGFLEALDDIFAPQTNCCPWGNEKEFSGEKLSLLFYKAEFC